MKIYAWRPLILIAGVLLAATSAGARTCSEILVVVRQMDSDGITWRAKPEDRVTGGIETYRDLYSPDEGTSLSAMLPSHLREILRERPLFCGPNCFGATRYLFDPTMGLSRTTDLEMDNFLDSQFDVVDLSYDRLTFEDALGIRSDGKLMHTVVYMGGGWVFHKPDLLWNSPYGLQRWRDVIRRYSSSRVVSIHRHRTRNPERSRILPRLQFSETQPQE